MWKVPTVFVFLNAALVWSGNMSCRGRQAILAAYFFLHGLFSSNPFRLRLMTGFSDHGYMLRLPWPFSLFPSHALSVLPQRNSISALTSCLVYILLQHVTVPAGRENAYRDTTTVIFVSLFLLFCPRTNALWLSLVTLPCCIQETQFRYFCLWRLFIKNILQTVSFWMSGPSRTHFFSCSFSPDRPVMLRELA